MEKVEGAPAASLHGRTRVAADLLLFLAASVGAGLVISLIAAAVVILISG
jgi:hypothetical protein